MVKKFTVCMVAEKESVKPGVIISPNEINDSFPYVMIAPITTEIKLLPFRLNIAIKGKKGQIAPDMIQTVSKSAIVREIGELPINMHFLLTEILLKMFQK